MANPCSVLIVDRSEETREVLKTALERRGLRIFVTGRVQRGAELAERHHPDLIVLDLEVEAPGPADAVAPLVEQSRRAQTPLVMLGTVRRQGSLPPAAEFVAKPYHYGPLVRKIEALLGATQQALARSA